MAFVMRTFVANHPRSRLFWDSARYVIGVKEHITSSGSNRSVFHSVKDGAKQDLLSNSPTDPEPSPRVQNDHLSRVKKFFLPTNYPHSVNEDYWSVQKYWNVQWATSSALQVFATQSLLSSVGIGSEALPIAATVNWVLKDVLACVGVMVVANKVGNYFDVNLKRSKWLADILLNLGVWIELSVQWFPSKFIILASVATLMKAVAGMGAGAAKANVNRHFSSAVNGKNLGDITAKGQSQGVFSYVVGLFYGVSMVQFCSIEAVPTPYVVLFNFISLTVIHLYCGYRSSANLNLRALNQQRGEIVTQAYLDLLFKEKADPDLASDDFPIPTPVEVSKVETFVTAHKNKLNLVMGGPLSHLLNGSTLGTVLSHTKRNENEYEKYLINAEENTVWICLDESVTEKESLKSFFHAQVYLHTKENTLDPKACVWEQSHRTVEEHFPKFMTNLERRGWDTNYVLLRSQNSSSQSKFSLVNE